LTGDDPIRVNKAMALLLRQRPDEGGLDSDDEGWVSLTALAAAVTRLLELEITETALLEAFGGRDEFEAADGRIRARGRRPPRAAPPAARSTTTPDILYHATSESELDRIRTSGRLSAGADRHVFLSSDEAQAWRVAHRLSAGSPVVLYVDAARSRRHGVRFFRNRRSGLYLSTPIPFGDILNLQAGFGEQVSAGGIPITGRGADTRMALIRVTRRSGTTWEVAKGKLELGESPEIAAVREVQEEMGVNVGLGIKAGLGAVRYGFLAPGGLPRLKTVHLFLMEPLGDMEDFIPAHGEGIGAVRWFPLLEAVRAVTHPSLVPVIRRAAAALTRGWPYDPGVTGALDEEP
jgi:RNA:NAD 2'-phosphotransferase (TPT1/KptA family)/8-oxo-dGTP pyrophosphatase MutT (NUDIX family)